MAIKYGGETLKLMSYFEASTKAVLKDCFVDKNGILNFIVLEGMSNAIGKGGENARSLEARLKRKIRLVLFSDVLETFVANLLLPIKPKDIENKEGIVVITPEPETRGYIIGRAGSNLRNMEETVKRYFDIKEIKVA